VSRSSGNVDLFAKKIVSDAGIINTFKKLLPTDVAKKSCECTGVLVECNPLADQAKLNTDGTIC